MQGRKGLLNGVASRKTRGKQKTIIPAYWHPEEIVDHNIGKLKNTAKNYDNPKWYNQPNYVEMYVEKIATVSNFQELVKDWEINLRHDKGVGSPEAIYQNCREIVKIMYQEDIQKKVTVCSA
jgi:hypothetical protein